MLRNSESYSPFSAYTPTPITKLFETFWTEMPTALTSPGSRPCTCEMRFWTSTAATSRSRVTSKVTVMKLLPSALLVDDM